MTDRQIAFLDFDGVLHPQPAFPSEIFGRMPLFEEWLVTRPLLDVVISSSWRMAYDLTELRSFFSEGLRARVVDVTPPGGDTGGGREHQIWSWLQANARDATWVAFDDSVWLFSGTERLVLCDPDYGLQAKNLDEADRLLMLPAELVPPVHPQAHPLSVVATSLSMIGFKNLDELEQWERQQRPQEPK
jgi:hypothetical protein